MPCCCIKTLNLCNVAVCGSLVIQQLVDSGGGGDPDYSLVLDYLGLQITITEEQADGENIHFDVSKLNEGFEYTGQIFNDEGVLIPIVIGENSYDCIKFKTKMNVEFVA